jgi:hypothetical protein
LITVEEALVIVDAILAPERVLGATMEKAEECDRDSASAGVKI